MNIPKKCPICGGTDITILYDDQMEAGCEYKADVFCFKCGEIGSITFYPTMKRNTFKFYGNYLIREKKLFILNKIRNNTMNKTNLIHIKEHNGIDISKMKIYFDDSTQNHKRRMICPICKIFLQCKCYHCLDDAVEDCNEGIIFYCNRHYLESLWVDDEMYELIDKKCNTNLSEKMKLIEMIDNGEIYPDETIENLDKRIEKINDECDKIIHELTDKQIDDIVSEMDFDCESLGSACDI